MAGYLRKQSPHKLWNIFKLLASFYLSRWLKKDYVWGLPMTLSIEPTTACNLRCPECPSGLRSFTRPTGNIKLDFYRQVIDEVHPFLSNLIFYFQGEPYIHPDFLKMVSYASQKNIYTISSTNGHFLTDQNARTTIESGLDRLIISVDGTSQEVYTQYRKEGNLDQVLQGARNIISWKKKLGKSHPYVIFQFLVVRPNEHQIPEIQRLAKEIGVDEVKLKTAQIYNYAQGNDLIPQQEKYSRYHQQEDGTYALKHDLHNSCWKLWHAAVITWNGWVVPCCFDKDASHKLGNLKENTFRQIWFDEPYRDFRRKILKGRDQIDICQNCSEGAKIWG